jgi:glycosyltransferase involved in cell wall biosynthesis
MPTPGRAPTTAPIAGTRMDMHCHSRASNGPAVAALGFIDCPECYSEPEQVYDQAKARGMDLVTLTDHDTIKGAQTLVERGFEGFIAGQEVTVYFPEDRCKLHVLVWDMSPQRDEDLNRLNLRDDVYQFAAWLRQYELPHALAHPLYMQNGRLRRWHIERAALLLRGFETLNGAHQVGHKGVLERFLQSLTPGRVSELIEEHGLEPLWPEPWQKAQTAGSDDHGLLNVGRTYTVVGNETGVPLTDPRKFLDQVMRGHGVPSGTGGHSALLAHQLTTVGAHYYADTLVEHAGPMGQMVASKLLRFAGVDFKPPSKLSVAADSVTRKLFRRRKKSLPLVTALRKHVGPMLERYPDLRERLKPDRYIEGSAMAEHERMAQFADELVRALNGAMGESAVRAFRKRDKLGIVDHLLSYGILSAAQLPYIFSLFYQNKERPFLQRFEHDITASGQGASVLERPMRISLFTDTLGDVNGVSRFITNVAEQSLATGRDLEVITCTRMEVPRLSNIHNFTPAFAMKIPKYENLEAVLPPLVPMLRHLDRHQPDCIHISTPGPVGLVGFVAAKMLRVPVLGVYHTDFPAYVDHLFEDHAFTTLCEGFMRFFYSPFSAVFTRSDDYVRSLTRLGLPEERTVSLMPGFDNEVFHVRNRDESIWTRIGAKVDPASVKVLYVGRVSVEKNLPLLTTIWKRVVKRLASDGTKAELVMVGDGPYREIMQRELPGMGVHFLGFRHGEELNALYATSDMFVFPSVTDTLGQVVMESQGSGLPVLVTDQGGPKEVVRDGQTGFVLSADDPDAWVDRVVQLVRDQGLRTRMSVAAHESMQTYSIRHSFEHFWDVHVHAWHEHLAKQGITPKGPEQVHRTRPRRDRAPASAQA